MNKNTCYKILNETLIDKKEKDTPFLPGILYRTGYELTSTLNGFHYVKKLEDLEPYLSCEDPYKNIVFECEHGDEFTNDGVLFASDSIQIIREVPFDEIIKYVKDVLIYKSSGKAELYSEDEVTNIKNLSDKVTKEKLVNLIYELSKNSQKAETYLLGD